MEIRLRSWCCQLTTFIVVLGIIQSVLYVLAALGLILWYLLFQPRQEVGVVNVIEVSNLAEVFPTASASSSDKTPVIILISGLVTACLGLITSLFIIVGVKTRQRFLLLPWLIVHFFIITATLVAGLYLIINYTILVEEKDYLKAALSLFLIVFGILFIFLWILVDQWFIRQGAEKSLIPETAARWCSTSSIKSSAPRKCQSGTVKSTRSLASLNSRKSLRSLNTIDKTELPPKHYKVQELSLNLGLPKLSNQVSRSRSMEYILDTDSNNSSKEVIEYKSLPRLSKANLKTRRNKRTHSFTDKQSHNDTIRSSRSLASVKSVTIDPQVREYRYQQRSRQSSSQSVEDRVNQDQSINQTEYELNPYFERYILTRAGGFQASEGHDQCLEVHPEANHDQSFSAQREPRGSADHEGVTEFRNPVEPGHRVRKQNRELEMERGISDLEVEDVGLAQIPSPVYPRSSSMERRLSPNYSRTSSQERRLSPVTTRSSSQERRLSPVIARSSSQERRLSHDLFLGKPRGPRRLTREEIIHKYCEGDVSL